MLVLLLSLACGDDEPDASTGTGTGTGTGTASASASASDTTPGTTNTTGSTTGSEDTDAPTSTSEATGTTSEEESEYCGLTDSGDAPWFSIRHLGADLEDGAALRLECGPQGSFMFEFQVPLGGFVPQSDMVPFEVTMSVAGFDVGPGGYFYVTQNYPVYIGCDEFEGGLSGLNYIRIFPPDEIAEHAEMNGAAVTLSFLMKTEGEDVPFEITGTVEAVEDETWGCCYDFEECFF